MRFRLEGASYIVLHMTLSAKSIVAAYPPLETVSRPTVPTSQAAYYLDRSPQTLREWAMTGRVITPHRINGRLAWPVAELKKVLGIA